MELEKLKFKKCMSTINSIVWQYILINRVLVEYLGKSILKAKYLTPNIVQLLKFNTQLKPRSHSKKDCSMNDEGKTEERKKEKVEEVTVRRERLLQ
jgi:hypothetical protein